MNQLVISKIETLPNGIKRMECSTRGPGTMLSDFEKHPRVICFLGDYYYHVGYYFGVILYRTH